MAVQRREISARGRCIQHGHCCNRRLPGTCMPPRAGGARVNTGCGQPPPGCRSPCLPPAQLSARVGQGQAGRLASPALRRQLQDPRQYLDVTLPSQHLACSVQNEPEPIGHHEPLSLPRPYLRKEALQVGLCGSCEGIRSSEQLSHQRRHNLPLGSSEQPASGVPARRVGAAGEVDSMHR